MLFGVVHGRRWEGWRSRVVQVASPSDEVAGVVWFGSDSYGREGLSGYRKRREDGFLEERENKSEFFFFFFVLTRYEVSYIPD